MISSERDEEGREDKIQELSHTVHSSQMLVEANKKKISKVGVNIKEENRFCTPGEYSTGVHCTELNTTNTKN